MFSHLGDCHTFGGIYHKYVCKKDSQEIEVFFLEMFILFFDDLRIDFSKDIKALRALGLDVVENVEPFERIVSKKHIIENDSHGPDVYALIVWFFCKDFRCHKVRSTTM